MNMKLIAINILLSFCITLGFTEDELTDDYHHDAQLGDDDNDEDLTNIPKEMMVGKETEIRDEDDLKLDPNPKPGSCWRWSRRRGSGSCCRRRAWWGGCRRRKN